MYVGYNHCGNNSVFKCPGICFDFFKAVFIDSVTDSVYYRKICEFKQNKDYHTFSIGDNSLYYYLNGNDIQWELEFSYSFEAVRLSKGGKFSVVEYSSYYNGMTT